MPSTERNVTHVTSYLTTQLMLVTWENFASKTL